MYIFIPLVRRSQSREPIKRAALTVFLSLDLSLLLNLQGELVMMIYY